MEEEDDFGDLYTDILHIPPTPTLLPANHKSAPISPTADSGGGSTSGEDSGKIPHRSPLPYPPLPESSSADPERREAAGDDWLLGGDPTAVEEPANWADDDDEVIANKDSNEVIKGLGSKSGEARVPNGVIVKASESEDWDSGSEDDLQIVLNDTGDDLLGLERRGAGGSDEDDEDLVIVTDDDQRHHLQGMEEQDWGEDATQAAADGEKKEMVDVAKGSGAAPAAAGAGLGYSNHGLYQQHHSMFKVSFWLAVATTLIV